MAEIDNRNMLVFGQENQEKLHRTKVLVVGSDTVSQYVCASLAGLSVGRIVIMDNSRVSRNCHDFYCLHNSREIGRKKVKQIAERLTKLNTRYMDDYSIVGLHTKFEPAFLRSLNFQPDIIFETTNDSISKEQVTAYSAKIQAPLLSLSSSNNMGKLTCFWPEQGRPDVGLLRQSQLDGQAQGSYTSGVIAGIAVEELRKRIFQYSNDGRDTNLPNCQEFVYNPYSTELIKEESDMKKDMVQHYGGKRALVIGGGALGTVVSLNLAMMRVGHIDIIDRDHVEESNLNRQFLHYDRTGIAKAASLEERLREISPSSNIRGIKGSIGEVWPSDMGWLKELYDRDKQLGERSREKKKMPDFDTFVRILYTLDNNLKESGVKMITKDFLFDNKYDAIFGCLDNKYARVWINDIAVRKKIPYIDGGTTATSGTVARFIPGKTRCIDCQLDLMGWSSGYDPCAQRPEGSVVMANLITGSMMVGEAIKVFYPILSTNARNELKYDANHFSRIYTRELSPVPRQNHCI